MCYLSWENLFRGANNFGAFCCHSRNTGASPFPFTISVLCSFTCITQHTGSTALRPIRRTKQLWLSVLLKDTSAATGQARIRAHILTTPELESNALHRSATTLLPVAAINCEKVCRWHFVCFPLSPVNFPGARKLSTNQQHTSTALLTRMAARGPHADYIILFAAFAI